MDDLTTITIRRGAKLALTVTVDDEAAVTAKFIARTTADAASAVLEQEVAVTDGVATFNFSSNDTNIDTGDYVYQVNVYDDEGDYDVYPDTSGCDDDCDLPTLTVCDAQVDGVS